jgi:hypothetical protein
MKPGSDAGGPAAPRTRRELELLAMVKTRRGGEVLGEMGFGNVIELKRRSLVLESNLAHAVGDQLTIRMAFPGVDRRSAPVVSLGCVVRAVRDAERMQYELSIRDLDASAQTQLTQFLSRRGGA